MQIGDGSYRKAENCETAVNKGYQMQLSVKML